MLLFAGISIFSSATTHGQSPVADGTVFAYAYQSATLQPASTGWSICNEDGGSLFESGIQMKKLTITNDASKINGKTPIKGSPADVSVEGDGRLQAYIFAIPETENHEMIIYGDVATIYAPQDCSYLFSCDVNGALCTIFAPYGADGDLEEINFECFNTQNVTNMSYMFYDQYSLPKLDLSGFDASSVEDSTSMYDYCGTLHLIFAPIPQIEIFKSLSESAETALTFGKLGDFGVLIYDDEVGNNTVEILIDRYYGTDANVVIPDKVNIDGVDYVVVKVGSGDGRYSSSIGGGGVLTRITIPSSVREIGLFAFGGSSTLTEIIINGEDTVIGNYAFFYSRRRKGMGYQFFHNPDLDLESCRIYVPSSALDYYKETYPNYVDQFVAIEENTGVIADIVLPSVIIATLCATLAYVSLGGKRKRI